MQNEPAKGVVVLGKKFANHELAEPPKEGPWEHFPPTSESPGDFEWKSPREKARDVGDRERIRF